MAEACGSDHGVMAGRAALLPVLAAQELDVHLGAVDAHQLAAAVGKAGGRQQQEELLQVQALDRAFHREDGVGVGDRVQLAVAAPGAIDGHDADIIAAAECYPFRAFSILCHAYRPAITAMRDGTAPATAGLAAAARESLGL